MIVNSVTFDYQYIKTCFAVLKIITKLKLKFKKKNLKIHIQATFIVIFSPIMDIHMCRKVKGQF